MNKKQWALIGVIALGITGFLLGKFVIYNEVDQIPYTGLEAFYPELADSNKSSVVTHSAYHLKYSEAHEQPEWVVYLLTNNMVKQLNANRKSYFKKDTLIETESATPKDYLQSNYDRGHMVPPADMRINDKYMGEAFLMSNVSPQNSDFNGGIWKDLEHKVRGWALAEDSLVVITGPVFKEMKLRLGKNKVTVPSHFFKVILDITGPDYKAVAFYMPNEKSDKSFWNYAMPVDKLEKKLNMDFFPNIRQRSFKSIEKEFDKDKWK